MLLYYMVVLVGSTRAERPRQLICLSVAASNLSPIYEFLSMLEFTIGLSEENITLELRSFDTPVPCRAC